MLHRNSPWILGNAVINEFAEKLLPDLELTRREFLCNSTIAIYYVEITGLSINPCAHLCNMKVYPAYVASVLIRLAVVEPEAALVCNKKFS